MPEPVNISEVVTSFYSDLKTVSAELNSVSDELGKSVNGIDSILRNFNLGIEVWVKIRGGSGDPEQGDFSYWSEDIGYAKYRSRWGICLREVRGEQSSDTEEVEQWYFNDAPRALRLRAIDCLVQLLQKLIEEGRATTEKIREKLSDAETVAAALSKAALPIRRARLNIPTEEVK
jgi:hypothetical protein